MEIVDIKCKDGGYFQLKNIYTVKYLHDETHYFVADSEMAVNHVTVINGNGFFVREYNTQSYNAI